MTITESRTDRHLPTVGGPRYRWVLLLVVAGFLALFAALFLLAYLTT